MELALFYLYDCFVIMLVVISYVKFPKVELKEDEKAGTVQNYKELLKQNKLYSISWGLSLMWEPSKDWRIG